MSAEQTVAPVEASNGGDDQAGGRARADVLVRTAHDSGYRFPSGFAGFTATLHADDGGEARESASAGTEVTVSGPRQIELAESGDRWTWARRELASIVGHRWAADYAAGDGRHDKHVVDGATNANGDLVAFSGDRFDSAYRVRDGRLSEVHRTAGGSRFTIVTGIRVPAGDRWLPGSFTVYYWGLDDAAGLTGLQKVETFLDEYVEVDGVHLPRTRTVTTGDDTGLTTRRLELSGHRLRPADGSVERDGDAR